MTDKFIQGLTDYFPLLNMKVVLWTIRRTSRMLRRVDW